MPSKLHGWSRSNRSQQSLGSTSDRSDGQALDPSNSASNQPQFQLFAPHTTTNSQDLPKKSPGLNYTPAAAHDQILDFSPPKDRRDPQGPAQHSGYLAPPEESQGQEQRKSFRSKFGLKSSRDRKPSPHDGSRKLLGRSVSLIRKEPPVGRHNKVSTELSESSLPWSTSSSVQKSPSLGAEEQHFQLPGSSRDYLAEVPEKAHSERPPSQASSIYAEPQQDQIPHASGGLVRRATVKDKDDKPSKTYYENEVDQAQTRAAYPSPYYSPQSGYHNQTHPPSLAPRGPREPPQPYFEHSPKPYQNSQDYAYGRPPSQHSVQSVQSLRQYGKPPFPLAPAYQAYDPQVQGRDIRGSAFQGDGGQPPQAGSSQSFAYNMRRPVDSERRVSETMLPRDAQGAPHSRQSLIPGGEPSGGGMSSFGTPTVAPASHNQTRGPQQSLDNIIGRSTPPLGTRNSDLTDQSSEQSSKDYKELKEKYSRVKRLYFEKEAQVQTLQNTLAHQRLSQSRTLLDDSEYTARFSRLDGLISNLAFVIRKSWKTIPAFLQPVVNKDATSVGKQEMTAVGRAFISRWLVDEIFDRHFHPDLEMSLSQQLKVIQRNIRSNHPPFQSIEEESNLDSKIINWRLTTIEGLTAQLKSSDAASHRHSLVTHLSETLKDTMQAHLADPPPQDLATNVPMIIELAIGICRNLPLESRDVCIEYHLPNSLINPDIMNIEKTIPALGASAESASVPAEVEHHASFESAGSDTNSRRSSGGDTDMKDPSTDAPQRKKGVLGSLISGSRKSERGSSGSGSQGLHKPTSAAGTSQTSLSGREAGGPPDLGGSQPRVRFAVFVGLRVRGKSVLLKAPVFST